jgi:two-component system, OmpR family, response regulator ChvI
MSQFQDVWVPVQTVGNISPAVGTHRISVVLVEDDADFREAAAAELEDFGFDVKAFADGAELLASIEVCRTAQVIVLDWFLKAGTGDALLLGLRQEGIQLPVVFLTGRSAAFLETLALDHGAVDFVDKSRGMPILARRLRLIVETKLPEPISLQESFRLGALTLKPRVSRAFWNDTDVELTLPEFKVVQLLASNSGNHVTYRAIYDCIHHRGFIAGSGENGFRTSVRSSIKRIRHKFKFIDPSFDEVENYASFGYCWRKD